MVEHSGYAGERDERGERRRRFPPYGRAREDRFATFERDEGSQSGGKNDRFHGERYDEHGHHLAAERRFLVGLLKYAYSARPERGEHDAQKPFAAKPCRGRFLRRERRRQL